LVVPFCAVHTTVITFCPTLNGKAADAVPDATVTPLTVMVAAGSEAVGVIIVLLVPVVTVLV
jgi:hypothetical protein